METFLITRFSCLCWARRIYWWVDFLLISESVSINLSVALQEDTTQSPCCDSAKLCQQDGIRGLTDETQKYLPNCEDQLCSQECGDVRLHYTYTKHNNWSQICAKGPTNSISWLIKFVFWSPKKKVCDVIFWENAYVCLYPPPQTPVNAMRRSRFGVLINS